MKKSVDYRLVAFVKRTIQGVSKMLRKTSIRRTNCACTYVGKGMVFELKDYINNKYLNYVIFYLQLTQYINNTCSHVNNCCVLTVNRVTIHNICSRCSPPVSTHIWARRMMDYHTLSYVLG